MSGNTLQICERNIFHNALFQHQPFYFPVFCDKSDSVFHCLFRRFVLNLFSIQKNLSRHMRHISKNCLHDLRSSGSHQSGYSQHFPCMHFKRNLFKYARTDQIFYFQNTITDAYVPLRIPLSNLSSDHHFDYIIHICLRNLLCVDISSIPQDRNPVAQFKNLFHPVRNINNGYAFFPKPIGHFKQYPGLTLRQRCRRFIHNDDFGICHQRLCNLNHLLLSYGKLFHPLSRIDLYSKAFQDFFSFPAHCFFVTYTALLFDFFAEKHIFFYCQIK